MKQLVVNIHLILYHVSYKYNVKCYDIIRLNHSLTISFGLCIKKVDAFRLGVHAWHTFTYQDFFSNLSCEAIFIDVRDNSFMKNM